MLIKSNKKYSILFILISIITVLSVLLMVYCSSRTTPAKLKHQQVNSGSNCGVLNNNASCNKHSDDKNFKKTVIKFFSRSLEIPEGITPVKNFKLEKYLGTWFEIARLNHSFEKGLVKVTATYSLNNDNTIRVTNKGFKITKNTCGEKEKKIIGVAKPVEKEDCGHLKVSFFRPFYGSYIIFYLETKNNDDDSNYSLALVTSSSKKFCWVLSRETKISREKKNYILNILEKKGFDINLLIFPWENN